MLIRSRTHIDMKTLFLDHFICEKIEKQTSQNLSFLTALEYIVYFSDLLLIVVSKLKLTYIVHS